MLHLVLTKERLLAWISIISLVVITLLYFVSGHRCSERILYSKYEVKNHDAARRAFIESFSISLKETPPVKETVIFPSVLEGAYEEYENIQNEMGLSLIPFQGKKVQKYTYEIQSTGPILYANLFIYDKYVVACDVVDPNFETGSIRSFADFID